MAYTKYLLTAGLCSVLAASSVSAQEMTTTTTTTYTTRDMTYRGQNYDVFDSNLYAAKRLDQYRQYMNHDYVFPPKPRNQWEIGVNAGLWNIIGDIPSLKVWQKANSQENFGSYGIGGHLRKALGYTFSLRGSYTYGVGKGQSWQPTDAGTFAVNNPGVPAGNPAIAAAYSAAGQPAFYNYRTEAHNANLDLIANLTNILFHKARPAVNVYTFLSAGAIGFGTRINALDANYNIYNYTGNSALGPFFNPATSNGGFDHSNRKDVREALVALLDGSYETDANINANRNSDFLEGKTVMPTLGGGLGLQFRLSRALNLSIEDRITIPFGNSNDYLDGIHYANAGPNYSVTSDRDFINYANIGLNFNLGNRRTTVEPLYWLNPLDHAYSELSNPRHMILPDPVLTDSDGDGVVDQFDKCPGTPAGVAVDAHGCPMDTDGDGVPDDRDRQLITPTECQPVDADGVGNCPCHCEGTVSSACSNIGAGSLTFSSGSSRITPAMQSQLSNLAAQMQANPTCKVVIVGNGSGSKVEQQRSWDRVNSVIEYMSERSGIDRGRFIFQYGGAGSSSDVMYRSANSGEEGPSNVAPPFPNLRRD